MVLEPECVALPPRGPVRTDVRVQVAAAQLDELDCEYDPPAGPVVALSCEQVRFAQPELDVVEVVPPCGPVVVPVWLVPADAAAAVRIVDKRSVSAYFMTR